MHVSLSIWSRTSAGPLVQSQPAVPSSRCGRGRSRVELPSRLVKAPVERAHIVVRVRLVVPDATHIYSPLVCDGRIVPPARRRGARFKDNEGSVTVGSRGRGYSRVESSSFYLVNCLHEQVRRLCRGEGMRDRTCSAQACHFPSEQRIS